MKKKFLALALLFVTLGASAQDGKKLNIALETRADLAYTAVEGKTSKGESGFGGYIQNIIIKGELSPSFSYAYRQRLNKWNKDASYFDSVDWVFLNYHAGERFTFTVGKTPVGVAGWELDLAPIDCFFLSSYNYHYNPYQWGGSVTYNFANGSDNLMLQMVESPFQREYIARSGELAKMFGYSLKWGGRHGLWEPNWSVNFLEYAPGKMINYISLGNRFYFGDKVKLELDYMNRASGSKQFLGQNFTLVGNLIYQPIKELELYAKGTWDLNKTDSPADYVVTAGTDIKRVGGGIHYYPLKDNRVRLHANYSYSFGTNTQTNPYVRDQLSMLNMGITWRVKIY
ncbi:hypothetical protein IX332_000930 [Porphyromonas levii]|uniref:porin n=1 Tax=Porphyromonas levii TaxID=28114 RepID=UPI000370DBC3|nr:porin [Porphyromonas levii]MBR8703750.1 hypothetical protein [Porphyromonas levii]MBR8729607.1 hypothetical protein [Porphyromonas levii]MBR8762867.1 hypothetical protein [Porphyromonas levii]MBR8768972.1 hypothetical protein [Porphyromonas levii]MBR8784364.1 hypothetical protein [Porphyromonas levii]